MELNRRQFITAASVLTGAVLLGGCGGAETPATPTPATVVGGKLEFSLPELPYAADALAPHIDAQTMRIHHGKHHAGYVRKLNAALAEVDPETLPAKTLEGLFANLSSLEEPLQTAVRNSGGGHYNHSLFWPSLRPPSQTKGEHPPTLLLTDIEEAFGAHEEFAKQFQAAAGSVFGSGWAWLVRTFDEDKLAITTSENQDNPLMDDQPVQGKPLLGVDVWEHAYYLKYQNQRGEYLKNWWSIVNWAAVYQRNGLA